MTDVQRIARIVAASKLLADAARLEGDAARTELTEHMRTTGTERVRVTDLDGENVGAVSLAKGRLSAVVVDDEAFANWVHRTHRDKIVTTVDPTWRHRLLANMATLGDPVDPETGEIVPGVVLDRADPYLTVRPTQDARDRMRSLLASAGLLELDGGPDAAPA